MAKNISETKEKLKDERMKKCRRCKDLSTLFYRVGRQASRMQLSRQASSRMQLSRQASRMQLNHASANPGAKVTPEPELRLAFDECSCEQDDAFRITCGHINWEKLAKWIDWLAIMFVPLAFLIFNITYWAIYEGLAHKELNELEETASVDS